MRASHLIILAILLLSRVLLLTERSTAQSVYGQVSGRLTTVAGTPVSGASVSVTSVQTGARVRTKSDNGGYFNINNLGPDLYQVDVQADGFKRVQATIVVNADSTTSVNAPLQAGDPKEVAAPTAAEGSALKLDRTDVSTLFDSRAIAELPLQGLNLTRLQLLVPGAARAKLLISTVQNPQGGQPVYINGQHYSGSAFQLDGTEDRDPLEGIVVINPMLDSVREMKVTTQGYNAEFGQATAGVVTIQTKSGSNAWHGDGFGFRRTGWGQSQDPFAPAGVPPIKQSIFGGSLGGPIIKNKLFIFGDYQGTRSSQNKDLLLSVPTERVRNTCLGPGSGVANCDLSEYSGVISGPLTDKEGNKFPGDMIPNNGTPGTDHFVSSQAAGLLTLLPHSNYTNTASDLNCPDPVICDNFLASGQEVFSGDQFDIRTDYNASSRLRLFARYSFGEFYDNGAPAFPKAGGFGTNPAGFAGVARTRNQGIASGFTYTLGPKLLTDFRFGYFRYRLNVNSQDFGQTPALGIPGIYASALATGLPDFEIGGQKGLSSSGDYLRLGYSTVANDCNCPLREREQQFQFVNNWTRSAGTHIIKWGTDLRFLQNYRLASDRPRTGYFDFSPGLTGLGLATFLIGDVTSFQRYFSSPAAVDAGEHQKRFGFYGQDTWRINSRLSLNYGLRWEIYFPQTVTGAGGFLLPNLSDRNPKDALFNTPATTDTAGGVTGTFTNFAPRLGIAYLINPNTVVRAGYGRSFDAGYAGDLFGIAPTQNPPVTVDQNIQGGGFNLAQGPPLFNINPGSHFSLMDLVTANAANPTPTPPIPASGAVLYALPSRVRVPTVDSWNLTFQHELTSHLYFEVGYVGNKGTHVFTDGGQPGQQSPGTFYLLTQPTLQGLIAPAPGPTYRNCKGNKKGVFPGNWCLTNPDGRSFYGLNPSLFNVRYFGNNANDSYHSLQAKVSKNFSRGFSFLANYTWSKGLDYDQNYFAVDPRIGYGPASFDIRHRFVMTNIWDLPVGRGKAWLGGIRPAVDRFVGGWTMSAITIWQSGLPFTPSYGNCAADTDPGDPCRPNRVGIVQISGNREQYFSTTGHSLPHGGNCSASGNFCGVDNMGNPAPGQAVGPWQRPGAGQIGNVGRNSLVGPGFFQSDIAVAKTVALTERASLGFRADVFNVFNRVNLGFPNSCVDCQTGGLINSLAAGAIQREFQFSLRILF
jgi:outer membrane receptor protein involved in Fe transport